MDPLNHYGFMTDGAFARNHRAHPECGNQFWLLFWRVRHVSGSQQWRGEAETCICQRRRDEHSPRVLYDHCPKTRCSSEVCLKSYYSKTTLSRPASIAQRTRESVDPRLSLWEIRDLGNDGLKRNWVTDRLVSYVQDWSDELSVLRKP